MSRRTRLAVLALVVLVVGAPAMAHDPNGSGEEQKVSRSCGAPADPRYSPPSSSDCKDSRGRFDASRSYQSTHYSNNVRCGSRNQVSPAQLNETGVRVYGSAAGVGTCSDGSGSAPAKPPIQGRATLSGSATTGVTATVDGDRDNVQPNNNPTLTGWIRVRKGADTSAPTYVCGDEYSQNGRGDSDHASAADTSGECGS